MTDSAHDRERHAVAVLGAGFGGLAMAHHLRKVGVDDIAIFERDDGVGGTWRANRYPGAACDVPSHLYSLSFARKPDWSSSYAAQPEILAYIEDCYDRLDVRRHVRLSTAIVAATWQHERDCWRLRDEHGHEHEADVVVSAIGLFHTPAWPTIEGLDRFGGTVIHSARWPDGHDLAGERVAVIGTGASAIQVVPAIASHAAHVDLYQRTPAWVVPRRDTPFSDEQKRRFARNPVAARRARWDVYRQFEKNTTFVKGDPSAEMLGLVASSYLAHKVPDEDLRARLTPAYPIGCKRVLVSSAFYPAVQRDDVDLVTDPIARVTPTGVTTADGTERPCDTIVLCTGFRATEYLRGIDVVGRHASLHDHWAGVPRAYLGMAVPSFPNLFLMYGPNTNQGGNSIVFILEAQARYVARALRAMRRRRATSIEVRPEVMQRYSDALKTALDSTVWNGGCDSYFRTSDGDIVTQLPYPSLWYWRRTRRVARRDFLFTRSGASLAERPQPVRTDDDLLMKDH